jgi:hypothetical protein
MREKVRWTNVTIALALIAALVIAAPAFGGPSLKKLVKKEVAKQIAKATGPAGPQGPSGINGVDGTDGVDGTARAYARVLTSCPGDIPAPCPISRAKGVASATEVATGVYCIDAPSIPSDTPAAVSVDWDGTVGPEGNASAMVVEGGSFTGLCSGAGLGEFIVATERQPVVNVRNAADTGPVAVAGNAVSAGDVSFTIVIP